MSSGTSLHLATPAPASTLTDPDATAGTPAASARATEAALQRAFDLLLAAALLVLLSPLLMIACALIRLDSPGPAIFRQRRLGRERKPFTVHKLRTMRAGASTEVHEHYVRELIAGENHTHSDGSRTLYKLAGDDRVTRVGRLLRRTSLDELPQLLDVLRGHMSLVGPRPVTAYEAELYPPACERRFEVRPGLTGLWQVSGRNERTYHEMLALDIAWVERRSLGAYLSILARTPLAVLRTRGAA